MSTTSVVIITIICTVLTFVCFPKLLGLAIYGVLMVGRVIAGIFGAITGKHH